MYAGEYRRLYRDGPAAADDSRNEHAQLVMPLGPVDGEEQAPTLLREQAQQLRCEQLIINALIAEETIEPRQRTAHLGPELDGQVPGQGQRSCLCYLGNSRNHSCQGLLLGAPKRT